MHSSIVFCNTVSADRSEMAAPRLLFAAAACAILLCFAAESRKSHCNGSVRRVKGALAAIFFDLAVMIFLLFFFLTRFKIIVFLLWRRDPSGFGAAKSQQFVSRCA